MSMTKQSAASQKCAGYSMAWIKLETHTIDKLEIYSMAQELNIDPDSVLGKCCRVWAWFDANTTDGVTKSVTKVLLDRQCGVTGFCLALINAGWMLDDGETIQLPYYDRHNSATAKARALGSKRQVKFKSNAEGNATGNAVGNDEALPKSSHREEKRREDKEGTSGPAEPKFKPLDELALRGVSPQVAIDWLAMRKNMKAPVTATVIRMIISEAAKANLSLESALEIACRRSWRGFESSWLRAEDLAGITPAVKDWI